MPGTPQLPGVTQLPNLTGLDPQTITAINQALQGIQQLQGMQSASEIAMFLGGPAVQQALSGLGIQEQAQAIGTLIQSVTNIANIQQILQGGGAAMIANAIQTSAPGVAQLLGGQLPASITDTLTQLASGEPLTPGGVIATIIATLVGGGGGTGGGGTVGGASCTLPCAGNRPSCRQCETDIPNHYGQVRSTVSSQFQIHRAWFVNTFWFENILPALMQMSSQLTAVGVQQIHMIGAMLDAKNQLETQRLFQQMTAEAHKDYYPSEGMCTFGTSVRSLAASERKADLAHTVLAERMGQRQRMAGDSLSKNSDDSDILSRLDIFRTTYCDPADNAKGLAKLCPQSDKPTRRNMDIDFTRNIESRMTLDVDFTGNNNTATPDEQDVFALAANLFSHNVARRRLEPSLLARTDGKINLNVVESYMDLRAIFAKRSVAQNSFAAIASERAAGTPESAPYVKALMKELGLTSPEEIEKFLGEKPSYFAQMEVLTKKLYQNPTFYTELYDKPANIDRKTAAMQAIGLMQDRDLFDSLLRTEAVLSVLLETMLQKEQSKIASKLPSSQGGAQ